ncbi:MAG: hypothetical protein HYZ74_04870 [Elusimicrobia bacterium]|nr:hypothetical protein [Elusimicrobiota bacterium]
MKAVRAHFRPEFVNRLDDTIIFNPLGREQAGAVVNIHLHSKVRRWLAEQGIDLERASAAVVDRLAELGFNPLYGGRPLARAVQRLVLDPLSQTLLAQSSDEDERVSRRRKVVLDMGGDEIVPRLETLPAEPVAERVPVRAAAAERWTALLAKPEAELGVDALESFLFGPPEQELPAEPRGVFRPMRKPVDGEAAERVAAGTDNPDLKDPSLDDATRRWTEQDGLAEAAAEAFRRWLSKAARCVKATNNVRPQPHEGVSYERRQGEGFTEYRVRGLPLTRAELLLNARIFENHYAQDSASEDQSWALADALLARGEYGRAELFEIKRLLNQVPGAEFGYWSDRQGLAFWLKLPTQKKGEPPAVTEPEAAPKPVDEQPAPEPTIARVSAADAEADAPSMYRYLTQDAPAAMRPVHELIEKLLGAADPIATFWGFRFARAALREKGFEPDGSSASDAARSLALGGTLPADLSKRFVDEVLAPYKRFRIFHRRHIAARWLTLPLVIATVGIVVASLTVGRHVLLHSYPTWVQFVGSVLGLAGLITVSVGGFNDDWLYDKADKAYDKTRARLHTSRVVSSILQPADRKRLAAHYERVLRGRWTANKREKYSFTDRSELRNAHWAAAQGLEDLRADLTPQRARSLAQWVMARAEKDPKKDSRADRLAPLMMLELLDDAQKSRALAAAVKHIQLDGSPASLRFLRLAKEGLLPAVHNEEVIQMMIRALSSTSLDDATIFALSESLAVLAKTQPANARLLIFEGAFGTRTQFNDRSENEKPVAFYAAMRELAPHAKAKDRIFDHLLTSERSKTDQLAWLLSLPELDAERRKQATDSLIALSESDPRQDPVWGAIATVSRLNIVPRERRVQILTSALRRLSVDARGEPTFAHYARAAEAVRLLAELEDVPAP